MQVKIILLIFHISKFLHHYIHCCKSSLKYFKLCFKNIQSCNESFPDTIPFSTDNIWLSNTLCANFEPLWTANDSAVSPLKSDFVKSAPCDKSSLTLWGWFCIAANIRGVTSFSSKASTSAPWLIKIRIASWCPWLAA